MSFLPLSESPSSSMRYAGAAICEPPQDEQHDDALHQQGGQAEWLGPVAGAAAVVPGQARGAADGIAEDRYRGDRARNKPHAQVVSSDHRLGQKTGP